MTRRLVFAMLVGLLPAIVRAQSPDSTAVASDPLTRPDVSRFVDYFTGPARDRMSQWLSRGTPYRDLIARRLDKEGLPSAFGYLPLIESGFANDAVSKAGAVGMWQFIPSTARQMGLRVDQWVDERRDPYRATDAAVRHIRDLTQTFGSPLLAAAAYNGGAGRVSRGLERLGDGGLDADSAFFALADNRLLAKETRDYVPELLAAAAIGRDPAKFGFTVDTTSAPAVDSVKVDRPIRLASAETALGLGRSTLAGLNPHFIRGITPPGGSWLRVPAGFGDKLVERLASLPAVALIRSEGRMAKLGRQIRVKRGDTVTTLAVEHGVAEASLRRLNALPKWYRLRPGQILRLPATT